MNRLHHLRETLPLNIINNSDWPRLEFVILDYSSSDGLQDWIRLEMSNQLDTGLIVFAQLCNRTEFHMSHAKNLAHRIARGDIVCNLDADNFSGSGFASFLSREIGERRATYAKMRWNGLGGRLGFRRDDFFALGGYDESMCYGWGYEDTDLTIRADRAGLKAIWCHGFGKAIPHGDRERTRNTLIKEIRVSNARHKLISETNLRAGQLVANRDISWGAGEVLINFKTLACFI